MTRAIDALFVEADIGWRNIPYVYIILYILTILFIWFRLSYISLVFIQHHRTLNFAMTRTIDALLLKLTLIEWIKIPCVNIMYYYIYSYLISFRLLFFADLGSWPRVCGKTVRGCSQQRRRINVAITRATELLVMGRMFKKY